MADEWTAKELERLERRIDALFTQLDRYMLTKVHDAEMRAIKASIDTVLEKVAAALARISRIEDDRDSERKAERERADEDRAVMRRTRVVAIVTMVAGIASAIASAIITAQIGR